MTQLLLEGNPLSKDELIGLASKLRSGVWPGLRTFGVDDKQVELADDLKNISCTKIGPLLNVDTRKYTKLYRHARKATAVVVAFSASNGEVEWAGLFKEIQYEWEKETGHRISRWFPSEATISLDQFLKMDTVKDVHPMQALWVAPQIETGTPNADWERPFDFDVLLLCDTRMQWYLEDRDVFEQQLAEMVKPYSRVLMIGASMGGFGALYYAHLAHKVLAFSPQVELKEAHLRPGGSLEEYEVWQNDFHRQIAKAKNTHIEVHCGADVHLRHALAFARMHNSRIILHPICPRRPLTRVLKDGKILWGVVSAFLGDIPPPQSEPKYYVGRYQSGPRNQAPYLVMIPCVAESYTWELVADPPRPGDWYCKNCGMKVFKDRWHCRHCGKDFTLLQGTVIFGASGVRKGDWACGACESVQWSRETKCLKCAAPRDHPDVVNFDWIP
eukprot:GEMP01015381.1.p1 GENE.GEMP01015381.1~~GEMP01015381.1.p1  ORF type:complete len:443 (+),score=83.21 GEMP01015381.1:995-2323(+)